MIRIILFFSSLFCFLPGRWHDFNVANSHIITYHLSQQNLKSYNPTTLTNNDELTVLIEEIDVVLEEDIHTRNPIKYKNNNAHFITKFHFLDFSIVQISYINQVANWFKNLHFYCHFSAPLYILNRVIRI